MNDKANETQKNSSSKAPAQPEAKKTKKKWLIEQATSLGLALFLVFMIRSSVIEAFKIPSGSMIPTLLVGDHIFVNKFAYGFKLPFSDLFTDPIYLINRAPPKAGDIIVFKYPKDESFYYIKRVVGVPGDTIEIRSKQVYINNKAVAHVPASEAKTEEVFKGLDDPKYNRSTFDVYDEKLGERNHLMMHDKTNFLDENRGPYEVPVDSLFVMGDNRDFSNDSRFWGFVPYKNVKGRAVVIWLSLWMNFSENQFSFHHERFGTVLK